MWCPHRGRQEEGQRGLQHPPVVMLVLQQCCDLVLGIKGVGSGTTIAHVLCGKSCTSAP